MSKLLDKVNALFKKTDEKETRYQKALEAKEQEVISLQAELQEKQTVLKDMHKMKLLGDISESAYDVEKDKVQKLQTKYSEANKELQLIQEYKTDDIKAVIEELDEARNKYFKEHAKEIEAIRTELLESKLVYLEKLAEAGATYNEIVNPERKLDTPKIKMGMKNGSYISDAYGALSMVSIESAGYENLLIDTKLVQDALAYRKTPKSLKSLIEKRKA